MGTLLESYGAHYYDDSRGGTHQSRTGDLYSYSVLYGLHENLHIGEGDSMLFVSKGKSLVTWFTGEAAAESHHMAVILRGYSCGRKSCSLNVNTNLPYVNGCSTRQLFPPERMGDPTMQLLTIPPHTSEQVHHMHPTARVVYVLAGRGVSIIGQADAVEETVLRPGMIIVLDPMCPHHFRTGEDRLTVLPVHVFSSTPAGLESNHPMMNGTKEI